MVQSNRNKMMHAPFCVCPDSRVGHRSGSATVRKLRTNPDVCITRKRTKNKISGLKYIQYIVQCTECGGSQEMTLSGSEKNNIRESPNQHCSGEAASKKSGEGPDRHLEGDPGAVCSRGDGAQQHGLGQPERKEVMKSYLNRKPDWSSL